MRGFLKFVSLLAGLFFSLALSFICINLFAFFFLRGAPLWIGSLLALLQVLFSLTSYLWLRVKADRDEALPPLPLFLILVLAIGLPSRTLFIRAYEKEVEKAKAQGIATTFRELAPLNPQGRWGAEAFRILVEKHKKLLAWESMDMKTVANLSQKANLTQDEWTAVSKALRNLKPLITDLRLVLKEQSEFQFFKAEVEEKFDWINSGPSHWGFSLELSRLLCLEARSRVRSGDRTGAVQSMREDFQFAKISADDPSLIGKMIANAQIGMICKTLATTGLETPAGLSDLVARHLVAEGLKTEATGQCELFTFTRKQTIAVVLKSFVETLSDVFPSSGAEKKDVFAVWLQMAWTCVTWPLSKAYDQSGAFHLDYAQILHCYVNVNQPPPLMTPRGIQSWDDHIDSDLLPIPFSLARILINVGMPRVGQMYAKEAENDLLFQLLPEIAAARKWKKVHGSFPTESHIPDPFADPPAPVKVKTEKDHFLIYSVGHDGQDNAGSVENRSDIGFRVD